MNIALLKDQGKNLGLDLRIIEGSKKLLIRNIQKANGLEPCFLTEKRTSCNEYCDFRDDCKRLTAAWKR